MEVGTFAFGFIVFISAIIMLYVYLKLSHRFHWFDKPDESRKLHKIVIPTSAGMIFMLPVTVVLLWVPTSEYYNSKLIGLIMLLLLFLGGVDDFKPITAKFRLLIIALISSYFVYSVFGSSLNYLLLGVYVIGLIWWLNLYNFMDGVDGMAILHAIITATGYMVAYVLFSDNIIILPSYIFEFIFVLLAFLFFNFPKAKMFMGDSGSLSVAFGLSAIALYGISANVFGEILVISFHLTFIVDATLTLLTRMYFKHNLTQAHSLHLYQWLIYEGKPHASVSLVYTVITILLIVVTLYLHHVQASFGVKFTVLSVETIILSFIWYYYQNKTKFKQFAK